MRTLDSETNPDSESSFNLETVQEDASIEDSPSTYSPHKRSSVQHTPHSVTPKKKTPILKSRAHSTSLLVPSGSGSLKNSSTNSISNGRIMGHSSHTSGHSPHHSSNSSGSGAVRLKTVSVGSKPIAASSSPRRPNSGQSHKEKRHSVPSNRT